MTDNRTTELQSLSKLKTAGKLRYWRGTIEIPESELHAICDEIQAEHDQAIAATLGMPERTCRIEETYGNQYCTRCGEMVGTWDSESELCVSSNMVELWNYCPNCGARRVGE